MPVNPQILSHMLAMGGSQGPPAPAPEPEPDPFARPYDPVGQTAPPPAVDAEKLRLIQGLLQPNQHQDILNLAMQDARRPNMYMFDKSGGLRGAVDSDKRLGYGALASLLGADADRYSENNRAQMFDDEMDVRRLPFEQMTAADQEMADFRRDELQQRAAQAQMPYDRMTAAEQGSLDVERERLMSPQGRGGLSELDQQIIANDPSMQAQYRSQLQQRIFGGDTPPPAPAALRDQMADQVNDNEVSSIVQEAVPELRGISDYSKANKITAETLMEQIKSGDRGWESALQSARKSDENSPAGAASTVETLKKMKTAYDKVQQNIQQTRERLSAPETGIGMEGIPYGGRW